MLNRRACLRLAMVGFGLAIGLPAAAQSFPSKPVRIVVPQTPGGASDALARIIAQKLNDKWRQPVVVENKPGAGGNIGTELVAKSPADGYTLLMSYAGTQAINPSLYASLPYDSVKDFAPVATLATVPFVLIVNKNFAATDLKQFLSLAREKPDQIVYGSAGNGSVNHLLGVMVSMESNVRLMHVPYRGAAPALTDLMSGQIQAVFTSLPSVIGHIREGAVRPLAVTAAKRAGAAPDVPTIAEAGVPGFDVNPWFGLLAPAGTPAAIVRQINGDVAAALREKDTIERFTGQGAEPLITTPEQFLALLQADVEKWGKVVKASGAKLD
ncbi:MAG TPA: tripartite tricarboxylate transporter substrate binding protein [Alphaproteobacteria bacterium]|nr:tripartite tricarboxylate transporter substrate binding protein [Alphaproteobacteria bacterium]